MEQELKKIRCLCRWCHILNTKETLWDNRKTKEHPVITIKKKIVLQEKRRRGKCLLCNKKVTNENENCFIFDHGLNFNRKKKSVACIVGRKIKWSDESKQNLQKEMNLCRLLCANCDSRETRKELWGHSFPKPWEEEKKIFWNF